MIYHVYMLINLDFKKNQTYVGFTNNLVNRLIKHNTAKGAKFTRGRYWELIYFKSYKSKKTAMKNEYKLKKDFKLRKSIKNNYLLKRINHIWDYYFKFFKTKS